MPKKPPSKESGKRNELKKQSSKKSPRKEFEPVEISTHRDLSQNIPEINRRLNENPELAKLLLVNPALAFKEVGAALSPEITHHILHTIQHSTTARQRQDEMEKELQVELGEKPQPHNAEWVSKFLFEKLDLKPLDVTTLTPLYRSPLSEETFKRLQALRPAGRRTPKDTVGGRPVSHASLQLDDHRPAARRLDLDADLPKMKRARSKPKGVDFEELYFYKDSHPLVRKVLEFGILQIRSFPVVSADRFRKIRNKEEKNLLYSWIKSVRFPEEV
jgi:hypothetical protein